MLASAKIRWNRASFLWHGLLAGLVIFQLSMILLRGLLENLHATELNLYQLALLAHKSIGILTFFVVCIYLLGKLAGYLGSWRNVFPWISRVGRAAIIEDIKSLGRLCLPVRIYGGGLAGLVQGLGLLLIAGVASSGFLSFLLWNYTEAQHLAAIIFSWHRNLAVLVWWFIGGHSLMALLHRLLPKRFWNVIANE